MIKQVKVTDDRERSDALIREYDEAEDTGAVFTDYIKSLGFEPPELPYVEKWGICVIGDDNGVEWLAWDAEEVVYPEHVEQHWRTRV